MRHILGMAKSNLDLVGAKSQKLELDVQRLIYAVQHLSSRRDAARRYMVVLSEAVRNRVQTWLEKYEATDCVTCLCPPTTRSESLALAKEKRANLRGMIAGSTKRPIGGRSAAHVGRKLGESALHRQIVEREPGVVQKFRRYPLGVHWDYYGTVE